MTSIRHKQTHVLLLRSLEPNLITCLSRCASCVLCICICTFVYCVRSCSMCLCILFVGHLLKPRYKRVFVFFVCPDYQAIRQWRPTNGGIQHIGVPGYITYVLYRNHHGFCSSFIIIIDICTCVCGFHQCLYCSTRVKNGHMC